MPNIHVDQYITLVLQSNLVKVAELEAALAAVPAEGEAPPEQRLELLSAELISRKNLTAWQDEILRTGEPRSFFLGKYKLLELIPGPGPFKSYVCETGEAARRFVLRLYPPHRLRDAEFRRLVLEDARQAQALQHPGLQRLVGVETFDPVVFQILEQVPGKNLADVVAETGPLPPAAVTRIAVQVIETLSFLHGRGLSHNRVRPANLWLGPGGRIKLLGLGCRRLEDDDPNAKEPAPGLEYLPPEELVASGGPPADLYGLGASLFFLLTGKPPISGNSPAEVRMRIVGSSPPGVGEVRAGVPQPLAELCRRLLAKEPSLRPTAAELKSAWCPDDDSPSSVMGSMAVQPSGILSSGGGPISLPATTASSTAMASSVAMASSGSSSIVASASGTLPAGLSIVGVSSTTAAAVAAARDELHEDHEEHDHDHDDHEHDHHAAAHAGRATMLRWTAAVVIGAIGLGAVLGGVLYWLTPPRAVAENEAEDRDERQRMDIDAAMKEFRDSSAAASAAKPANNSNNNNNNNTPQPAAGSPEAESRIGALNGLIPIFVDSPDILKIFTDRRGAVALTQTTKVGGTSSLLIENGHAGNASLPGTKYPVRANAGDKQIRYLSFSWKCEGEGPFGVDLGAWGKFENMSRNSSFYYGTKSPSNRGRARRLGDKPPSEWKEELIDLNLECGDFDFTGLRFYNGKGKLWVDNIYISRYAGEARTTGLPLCAQRVVTAMLRDVRGGGNHLRLIPLTILCGHTDPQARQFPGYGIEYVNSRSVTNWSLPWTHCRTVNGTGRSFDFEITVPPEFEGFAGLFCRDGSKYGRKQTIFLEGKDIGSLDEMDVGKYVLGAVSKSDSADGKLKVRIDSLTPNIPVVSMVVLFDAGKSSQGR